MVGVAWETTPHTVWADRAFPDFCVKIGYSLKSFLISITRKREPILVKTHFRQILRRFLKVKNFEKGKLCHKICDPIISPKKIILWKVHTNICRTFTGN